MSNVATRRAARAFSAGAFALAALGRPAAFALPVAAQSTSSAAPSAAPSGDAVDAANPLATIARVRATTPFCRSVLHHASTAVDRALDDDVRLVFVEQTLKTTDLDSDDLHKANGSRRILHEFVALRASAVEGRREMQALRDEAKSAPTEAQRASLNSFADALDGALDRQKKLADALGRFVAYVDAHDPISKDAHDRAVFQSIAQQNYGGGAVATDAFGNPVTPIRPLIADGNPLDYVPDQLSTVASEAAVQLKERSAPILKDESDAADRIDAAFAGC
jgi:hypothetical protein